jgi:hypothetical protein
MCCSRVVTVCAVFILAFSATGFAKSDRCYQHPEVIQPQSGPKFEAFRDWVGKNAASLSDPNFVQNVLPSVKDFYIVDFNNDGRDEYVVVRNEGSGSNLNMWVFLPAKDGFELKPAETPPPPDDRHVEGGWFNPEFTNPVTGQSEIFVRLCGKVYLSFMGDRGLSSRVGYLWQKEKTESACDKNWLEYNRGIFTKLVTSKSFGTADKLLRSLAYQCTKTADPTELAWLYSDLAKVQYKLGENKRCLQDLQQARVFGKGFSKSAALKQEVEAAKAQCEEPSQGPARVDFRWLLNPKLGTTNQVVWTKDFDALLRAVVPGIKGKADQLREWVSDNLGGPPEDKQVLDDRYVVLAACRAHSCGDKALVWTDTQSGLGVFAINDADYVLATKCSLAIGSRQVTRKDLPHEFWESFSKWKKLIGDSEHSAAQKEGACAVFVDANGKVDNINLPN